MKEMFRYLTGILDRDDRRQLIKLSFLNFITPLFDLFGFSVIIYILNTAIQENHASLHLILFSAGMGVVSLLKSGFELYK